MECRPTEHGWQIDYTEEEERLKEFIRTAPKDCGACIKPEERDEYRKEVLWLIRNKPTRSEVVTRGLGFIATQNTARMNADADIIDYMYTETALKDFYDELDKYSSRGCF